jgi:hypothetical protein
MNNDILSVKYWSEYFEEEEEADEFMETEVQSYVLEMQERIEKGDEKPPVPEEPAKVETETPKKKKKKKGEKGAAGAAGSFTTDKPPKKDKKKKKETASEASSGASTPKTSNASNGEKEKDGGSAAPVGDEVAFGTVPFRAIVKNPPSSLAKAVSVSKKIASTPSSSKPGEFDPLKLRSIEKKKSASLVPAPNPIVGAKAVGPRLLPDPTQAASGREAAETRIRVWTNKAKKIV